jgi:hypothetical protein
MPMCTEAVHNIETLNGNPTKFGRVKPMFGQWSKQQVKE